MINGEIPSDWSIIKKKKEKKKKRKKEEANTKSVLFMVEYIKEKLM